MKYRFSFFLFYISRTYYTLKMILSCLYFICNYVFLYCGGREWFCLYVQYLQKEEEDIESLRIGGMNGWVGNSQGPCYRIANNYILGQMISINYFFLSSFFEDNRLWAWPSQLKSICSMFHTSYSVSAVISLYLIQEQEITSNGCFMLPLPIWCFNPFYLF